MSKRIQEVSESLEEAGGTSTLAGVPAVLSGVMASRAVPKKILENMGDFMAGVSFEEFYRSSRHKLPDYAEDGIFNPVREPMPECDCPEDLSPALNRAGELVAPKRKDYRAICPGCGLPYSLAIKDSKWDKR